MESSIEDLLGEGSFDAVVACGVAGFAICVGACGATFRQSRRALAVVGVDIVVVLGLRDQGFVAVIVAVVYVGLFLERGVKPAVIDAEGDELNILTSDAAGRYSGILFLEVVCEFRAVVAAVGFREDSKVAVFVLGKLRVECLQ